MSLIKSLFSKGVRTIKLNRPERKNAMNATIYQTITKILNEDASDDKIVTTILTGEGDYFCSGTDISVNPNGQYQNQTENVKNLINSIINYPKLIISVANGPAIGIGATVLLLCDIVYASERATFNTPFVNLGLSAEAGSSWTFPSILGRSRASEMLLLNYKMSAEEAYRAGYISKIIPHKDLERFIEDLHKYGNLPINSLIKNKKLIMANLKPILNDCVERECKQLEESFKSEDFRRAMEEFANKKKSKK